MGSSPKASLSLQPPRHWRQHVRAYVDYDSGDGHDYESTMDPESSMLIRYGVIWKDWKAFAAG